MNYRNEGGCLRPFFVDRKTFRNLNTVMLFYWR